MVRLLKLITETEAQHLEREIEFNKKLEEYRLRTFISPMFLPKGFSLIKSANTD